MVGKITHIGFFFLKKISVIQKRVGLFYYFFTVISALFVTRVEEATTPDA